MFHIENRLTAPVPKLDGRTTLDAAAGKRRLGVLRSGAALLALFAGVMGTAVWLGIVAGYLFKLIRLVVG